MLSADKPSLEQAMPDVFREFVKTAGVLEKHYRDMQDLEFTVEKGKLFMLQARSGKRTAKAALRIAVEMANEGLISREQAVDRIDPARGARTAAGEPAAARRGGGQQDEPDAKAGRHRDPPRRPQRSSGPGAARRSA